ncbi:MULTISPECIES: OprD family outer membrane porin [Acinetobacter calcoaceticus/baumannii complex]|uniref:OprD family outer membrane porin n=2 Tax=Acinetobacter calcoaceticus/baumannii complex TaxID=909768 RepID=A0A3R9QPL4_9GAMM|nr:MULTISPECIES: OprD family outer membrane porin [Acinetobacter calcoaceticus/baumannii complex]MBJ8439012.1 OprD family outer membrane porin [Acinetobacter lactucae]MCG9494384.1 OprD family porin [Acinetobacter pittii]MCU4349187.1 OprD family porin [Acinetobacter lactucae]MDD9319609.1 OprD family outer membrane porin [Acinetobacter lactucae]RSO52388.1 outer membrane porin, OprD family [Acinetobacter lactucae]
MLKAQKLTLAVLISAAIISSAQASEQSEAKGFVEDANGSILFRTGYISRDKKNGVDDTSSFAQTAIVNIESGFTPGIVGFGVGVVGDGSFKIGENNNAGNNMIPRETLNGKENSGDAYDHWARGGGNVKARFSNTTVRYGTQVLDLPVLASNTARLVPEYFTGTLLTSREIKDLEVIAGKFTKNQYSDQVNTDGRRLDRAIVWGGKYKFDDNLNASYYGLDSKDKLERHYVNVNYKQPLANDSSLTYDFSGYHTKFDEGASTYSQTTDDLSNRKNNIWAISTAYNTGPHNIMVAYQQNSGNVGYDYGENADGGQSIYLPNSYLSDFIGNDEKSAQIQYSLDFGKLGVLPGLNWTTAFVYGWDIKVKGLTDDAEEREFFNQVKYTVQSGFAKDASLRIRNSYYRASDAYQTNAYIGDTNEWRIFLDIPVKLF